MPEHANIVLKTMPAYFERMPSPNSHCTATYLSKLKEIQEHLFLTQPIIWKHIERRSANEFGECRQISLGSQGTFVSMYTTERSTSLRPINVPTEETQVH